MMQENSALKVYKTGGQNSCLRIFCCAWNNTSFFLRNWWNGILSKNISVPCWAWAGASFHRCCSCWWCGLYLPISLAAPLNITPHIFLLVTCCLHFSRNLLPVGWARWWATDRSFPKSMYQSIFSCYQKTFPPLSTLGWRWSCFSFLLPLMVSLLLGDFYWSYILCCIWLCSISV